MNPLRRRRAWLIALALLVFVLHLDGLSRLVALLSLGHTAPIERLQAAFVRELAQATPPAPPPPPPPRRAVSRSAVVEAPPPPEAASAPTEVAAPEGAASEIPTEREVSDAAVVADGVPSAPEDGGSAPPNAPMAAERPPEAPPEEASAPAVAPAATASAPHLDWPLSTQVRYTLTGDYRGPVEGQATVEWVRESDRYQVRVELIIGAPFAPVLQRRMTSDGLIGDNGLMPRRYDEETRVAFAPTRRVSMVFEGDAVVLSNGRREASLPGVQDTASQFVQLTWLFLTGAVPLRAGGEFVVPLALPRRMDRWTYDVIGEEPLATPFGTLPTWHLKPRREGKPSKLSIETWFAPSLQYLPVRIILRQEPDSYADLIIQQLPQQAAP